MAKTKLRREIGLANTKAAVPLSFSSAMLPIRVKMTTMTPIWCMFLKNCRKASSQVGGGISMVNSVAMDLSSSGVSLAIIGLVNPKSKKMVGIT